MNEHTHREPLSEEELRKKLEKLDLEVVDKFIGMRSLKPVRNGEFLGVEQDRFYVAISEEEIYELTPLAYYIWALSDGEHTVEDMANDISENAEIDYYQVVEPLLIVLDEMKKVKLVSY
ncbi:MAG: PqqD family peptide modification chaperone [Desulfurococcaceae archaeon]